MNGTMQAAFVRAPWQFEMREIAIPTVKPGWVLVKVEACGICGTDLHIAGLTNHKLTSFAPQGWQGFGHEIAGVVDAVGAGVHNVREGDTVVLESGSWCGVCNECRNGRSDLCHSRNRPSFWMNESMGFAEYMLAPAQACVPYAGLTPEVACLAEPLGVALDMAYTADIRLDNDVLVLGLGPIGLFSIPIARRMGAGRIYAVNRSGGRRMTVAQQYGADEVIELGSRAIGELTFRRGGVERALVSASPAAIGGALGVLRYGGIASFIGIAYGDEARITLDANDFHFNKTQLRASHASPAMYFPTVLDLLKDGHVDGAAMISHTMKLCEIEQAVLLARDARREVLKIVITP